MFKVDFMRLAEKIPQTFLRYKFIDTLLEKMIPFNKGLGLRVTNISDDYIEIESKKGSRRKNHLGGVHACALALMGEYPAGLFLAKNFPPDKYRLILGELKIQYHKQVRNKVIARSERPPALPKNIEEEAWIYMETKLFNSKREPVATCQTKWQIKKWDLIQP
ncbi:MAG: DUF4442 domain-containing protein [Bdellovibrionales bacterium]|nr:DUF4442 domain-containing protein [Bdellovibrionales bacterium]